MAIDIGLEAIDRAFDVSGAYTLVNKNGQAIADGTIITVEVWMPTASVACVVGTFYTTNGNTLKCRDSEAVGNIASGSKQTLTGLTITAVTGDYIGMYGTTFHLEWDTSGFGGIWRVYGENIDPDDEADYTLWSDDGVSLAGTYEEAPAGWTGKISGVTNPAKIMGVAVANIAKVKGVA